MLTTVLVEGPQFYAKRKFLRYSQLKIWSQKLKQFCENTEYITFLGLFLCFLVTVSAPFEMRPPVSAHRILQVV